jgi:hypothetical protein
MFQTGIDCVELVLYARFCVAVKTLRAEYSPKCVFDLSRAKSSDRTFCDYIRCVVRTVTVNQRRAVPASMTHGDAASFRGRTHRRPNARHEVLSFHLSYRAVIWSFRA